MVARTTIVAVERKEVNRFRTHFGGGMTECAALIDMGMQERKESQVFPKINN